MFQRRLGGAIAVLGLIAAACGPGASSAPPGGGSTATPTEGGASPAASLDMPTAIGDGEGALDLVIWAGYAERGASDPAYDWVTPFETATGCKVTSQDMTDSNNGVSLMQSGNYDGISASGDATTRLIQGGIVAPVNVDLLSNWPNVFPGLKGLPHNTVNGVPYGVPHGRGPNLLGYNKDVVTPAPTTWDPIWEGGSAYKGKISIYDSSIFIADAALHLMTKHPELGIKDPYQLTQAQFDEAIKLLQALNANQPTYWGTATDQQTSYTSGDVVIGTTWQYQTNSLLIASPPVPVKNVIPTEGMTGWSDTWMLSKYAKHPNCMMKWQAYMVRPEVQTQVAEYFGEAPANPKACDALNKGHGPYKVANFCDVFHATDQGFYNSLAFWKTPSSNCGDTRGNTCIGYDQWLKAYTDVKG